MSAGGITLRPITRETVRPVIRLAVAPEQESFVANNARSLAQAYVEPDWVPLAICRGEEPVGFAMYGPDPDTGAWWLIRYMIAAEHQRKGYGRAALPLVIARMREAGAGPILLGCDPLNHGAIALYESFGFVPTGEIEDDEAIYRLDPDPAALR